MAVTASASSANAPRVVSPHLVERSSKKERDQQAALRVDFRIFVLFNIVPD
jgi:hypothetical protein